MSSGTVLTNSSCHLLGCTHRCASRAHPNICARRCRSSQCRPPPADRNFPDHRLTPALQASISFRVESNSSISTLSDLGAFAPDGMVQGLFYVPDLSASDPCASLSSQFLPRNVTRKANLPNIGQYALVGVAPWLSDHPECALPYIRASQADPSRGLIFFPTRPNAAISTPVWTTPDWAVNRSTWNSWLLGIDRPIWGIPADIGAALVQQMGKYSGNVTVSPFGSQLSENYPPEDAVRLLTRVALNSSKNSSPVLGRLWVFAIMILAILLLVTGLTSIIMHVNQRRMRRDLQRRIARGEVDPEILGIKRQKVPQKLLDKMPLYVYTSKLAPLTTPTKEKDETTTPTPHSFPLTQRKTLPKRDVPFSQTTCPICLDDFEHNDTVVRELPCQHIFHPECVDEFLRTNSSLCPMCKKSALPTGYCPENITISMVRRERMVRRYREIGTDSPPLSSVLPASLHRFLPAWLLRARTRPRQGAERAIRRVDPSILVNHQSGRPANTFTNNTPPPTPPLPTTALPPPPPQTSGDQDLEMNPLHPNDTPSAPQSQPLEEPPPEIQALSPEERREWGRQRLAATLPSAPGPAADEEVPVQQMGTVRRAWKKMFPS